MTGRKHREKSGAKMFAKGAFIRCLTSFLVGNQGKKSIQLEMGNEWATEWAELRSTTPIRGNPNLEEAEKTLREFLE